MYFQLMYFSFKHRFFNIQSPSRNENPILKDYYLQYKTTVKVWILIIIKIIWIFISQRKMYNFNLNLSQSKVNLWVCIQISITHWNIETFVFDSNNSIISPSHLCGRKVGVKVIWTLRSTLKMDLCFCISFCFVFLIFF